MKKEKGITLVALVITIVVLLILAGVAITALTGDNNIIGKAKEAKTKQDEASVNEDNTIKGYEEFMNNAFFCCGNLTSIAIPNSVISIGESAFDGCLKLKSIIYNGNTYTNRANFRADFAGTLGDMAFDYTGLS